MNEPYILLVEDNRDDETLITMTLRKYNIVSRVEVCRDGEAALEFFSKATQLPVLVLLDIKLPLVDGIEVLETLRADMRTRTLPIVILTSSREEKDVIDCYSLGCNSYVQKPVEYKQFSEVIRNLGLYWMMTNQPPMEVK